MTSPDIDSGTFKNYAENVCSNAEKSWILKSDRDKALMASRKVHGRNRLGTNPDDNVDADWRQPPTIDGLKTIDFTECDTGFIGHSVQPDLIEQLVDNGVTSSPEASFEFTEEVAGPYTIYKTKRTKKAMKQ